jgi:polyisoprenoid-binding protein YceI
VVRVPAGTWVRGIFKEFEGTIEATEDPEDCSTQGTVKVANIDTGNADRDAHLR